MPDTFEVWIISTTTMTYGEWLEERARQEEEHTRREEEAKRRREMVDRIYQMSQRMSEAERSAFAQRVQMEAMQRNLQAQRDAIRFAPLGGIGSALRGGPLGVLWPGADSGLGGLL